MYHKLFLKISGVTVLASLFAVTGCMDGSSESGNVQQDRADYTTMSAEKLADHLIFDANGFHLDQETQEGGTVRDRLQQDTIQKACSDLMGNNVDRKTATEVTEQARATLTLPEGGIKLGDWEKGEELARSGYGFRVGHRTDDHTSRQPGGNCYACHQMDPEEPTFGTLGPSLKGYGKIRGTSEATLKYTYEVIYNPHLYFPCTHMPRFGHNEFLTQNQISDVMAYLLDPDSPVNQ